MDQSKPQSKVIAFVCASLFGLLISPEAHAIRFDWTANEIACANSRGITLGSEADPSNPKFIEHMSWVADRIVSGVVGEIRHDIRGPYPTLAAVTVASSFKGGILPATVITVASMSGPSFSDYDGVMATVHVSGDQPSFTSGQHVLLFLSTGYDIRPENPAYFALPPGHYRLVAGHKFTLQGDSFALDGYPANTYSVSNLSARIATIVADQENQCGGAERNQGLRASTDVAGGEPDALVVPLKEDRVELCDFGVTESFAWANATLTFRFSLEIGDDGAPRSVEVLSSMFLSDEPFKACFMRWRLPVANERVVVLMTWEHGKGWTRVRIAGQGINRVLRIDPRFMRTSARGMQFPP